MEVFVNHPLLVSLYVAMAISIIDYVWQWPASYHPLNIFNLLADNMAKKVNKHASNNIAQQYISGTLAFIVIIAPNVILVALLLQIAYMPVFFDALVLIIALEYHQVRKVGRKMSHAIAGGKKELARYQLQHFVLRETQSLSPLGMAKAHIETVLLRFTGQFAPTLFWFLTLGSLAALTYRLLYEFSQSWNCKHANFKYFGKPVALLVMALQWLPSRIAVFCVVAAEGFIGAWQGFKSCKIAKQFPLAVMGGTLGIQLGGPAIYEGKKMRLPKVGGSREIRHGDIQRVINTTYKAQILMFVLYFLAIVLYQSV